MPVQIQRVTAAETFSLRQRILRPHDTFDELSLLDDDLDACHFGAVDDGSVIGAASVRRETAPWNVELRQSWRLRGMATAEDRRSQGVGTAILEAVIQHVQQRGGGLLWCNARMAAVSFYERAGFGTRGESWDDPILGPHIAMEMRVEPASA
jgi:GNAT superfamily N-acetyltransferase